MLTHSQAQYPPTPSTTAATLKPQPDPIYLDKIRRYPYLTNSYLRRARTYTSPYLSDGSFAPRYEHHACPETYSAHPYDDPFRRSSFSLERPRTHTHPSPSPAPSSTYAAAPAARTPQFQYPPFSQPQYHLGIGDQFDRRASVASSGPVMGPGTEAAGALAEGRPR